MSGLLIWSIESCRPRQAFGGRRSVDAAFFEKVVPAVRLRGQCLSAYQDGTAAAAWIRGEIAPVSPRTPGHAI
jgi:hypothetical protein